MQKRGTSPGPAACKTSRAVVRPAIGARFSPSARPVTFPPSPRPVPEGCMEGGAPEGGGVAARLDHPCAARAPRPVPRAIVQPVGAPREQRRRHRGRGEGQEEGHGAGHDSVHDLEEFMGVKLLAVIFIPTQGRSNYIYRDEFGSIPSTPSLCGYVGGRGGGGGG